MLLDGDSTAEVLRARFEVGSTWWVLRCLPVFLARPAFARRAPAYNRRKPCSFSSVLHLQLHESRQGLCQAQLMSSGLSCTLETARPPVSKEHSSFSHGTAKTRKHREVMHSHCIVISRRSRKALCKSP